MQGPIQTRETVPLKNFSLDSMAIRNSKTEAHPCLQLIKFIWTFTNIYLVRPVGGKRTDIEAEIGDDGVCVVLQLVLQGKRGEPRHGRSMNSLRQNGKETYKENVFRDFCFKVASIDMRHQPLLIKLTWRHL
jgi:hypothetical protein